MLQPDELKSTKADYLLRLGLTQRELPRIENLFHHENQKASAVSDDRRHAVTVGWDEKEKVADGPPLELSKTALLSNWVYPRRRTLRQGDSQHQSRRELRGRLHGRFNGGQSHRPPCRGHGVRPI